MSDQNEDTLYVTVTVKLRATRLPWRNHGSVFMTMGGIEILVDDIEIGSVRGALGGGTVIDDRQAKISFYLEPKELWRAVQAALPAFVEEHKPKEEANHGQDQR